MASTRPPWRVDGLRAGPGLDKALARRLLGEMSRIHAFRRDELMEFRATLGEAPLDTCWLTVADGVEEAVRARRAAWLEGR